MEINPFCSTRTGRTIIEKTMEDGNVANAKDEKAVSSSLSSLYSDRPAKYTTNGHDFGGEPSSPPPDLFEQYRPTPDSSQDDKYRKRINPLRIHLGKRPFVDNSPPFTNAAKKRKSCIGKTNESVTLPRVPKLIPKRLNNKKFHNISSQPESTFIEDEECKPVPRLVRKSQLLQFKKNKVEMTTQVNSDCASLMQPMVKFKCRKCCSMSFKTLGKLKEHQLVCRVQTKEPALSSEPASSTELSTGGPSRVTRKVYMCSACGTYYENWNLFLHMREAHNRHICLFCLGMFSKAEKLSAHLMNKHNVRELNFENKEEFMSVYNGTMYLMCCVCDEICCEKDDFFNHDCNKVIPKPVPVLVSRTGVKANNGKQTKVSNELSTNCSSSIVKESTKLVSDNKDISDFKSEKAVSQPFQPTAEVEPFNSGYSITNEHTRLTEKDITKTVHPDVEPEKNLELEQCNIPESSSCSKINKELTNGDKSPESSDESESAADDYNPVEKDETPLPPPVHVQHPPERECGIKLKLSLNNANSPVIINSTVDPTVGQQNQYKPPTRVRRPPKRYEKAMPPDSTIPPKTPTIKMTICDKPDNPFVKTTIFENNQETILKTLLNNNFENVSSVNSENKPDNSIKSTIYDNKIEDDNSLNRVPKLTVRVPKELLDKDSSSDYSSDSDLSDKLTVDENNVPEEQERVKEEPLLQSDIVKPEASQKEEAPKEEPVPLTEEKVQSIEKNFLDTVIGTKTEPIEQDIKSENPEEEQPIDVVEPITRAEPELPILDLTLDRPLDKYPLKDLLKVFLSTTIYNCIYCNHARKIAVNCEQLALHMVEEHRFRATVDSITAEELMPETISAKVKARAGEQSNIFINLDSYDSAEKCEVVEYDNIFECFQCYFKTGVHKDLCFHNRKMHQKTILLCVMCKNNFYSYSELLCHLCPGTYDSEYEIKFRCYLCNIVSIPSSFRLMVHLRKVHHTCDVCLEFCHNQPRLSNHVWKHKLNHLCFRCGIAYRNKPDITNHLFWKHGTESVSCKKCLQKKWPHVYHFCSPPAIFICEECNLQFTKAVCLKVHKRFHSSEFPHTCTEEGCTEKFVSKKLLAKHLIDHRKKLLLQDPNKDIAEKKKDSEDEPCKENIPIIDLVDDKPLEEACISEAKDEAGTDQSSKKLKKKKIKDKDALLLDVNLPELNLSESDSDESDSGTVPPEEKHEITDVKQEGKQEEKLTNPDTEVSIGEIDNSNKDEIQNNRKELSEPEIKVDSTLIPEEKDPAQEEKPNEQKVLEIWDNFKKYQETVDPSQKLKEKTPPLVPIRKHVCESDHDYCIIPSDLKGDEDMFSIDKKKGKKSPKKKHNGLSSSSSSSSDSDSSCSCGSNCSCSSSSGSSSSSSSDSDSSDQSGIVTKKSKSRKKIGNRRVSNGSNVDVMGLAETPILIPEKVEPPVAESDLETEESDTDEEFYDENPQQIANKLYEDKRNQMLVSMPPSDGGSISGEASRPMTPVNAEFSSNLNINEPSIQEKQPPSSSKKKNKKKKKSKNSRKHAPIKINIPKDIITKAEPDVAQAQLAPSKITISLQSNTVHIPETTKASAVVTNSNSTASTASTAESKRASKRRRVPNKFYGYSSDEDNTPATVALKPHQPPKLEWRKEDLPSPTTTKVKKEIPSTILTNRLYNSYSENLRLTAPIPDPEPPKILMNTESMESSDSDSSEEGGLEIYQGGYGGAAPLPPSYLNSGTSSLPYAFERPAVRQAREGESVYCYCRCPYDEVSEMIACDADGCPIEWFHFECVGIMVPPKGKWYCPECRKNQSFSGYR